MSDEDGAVEVCTTPSIQEFFVPQAFSRSGEGRPSALYFLFGKNLILFIMERYY